ncbi:MAG: rod shape-determining protein MreC [Holophagales bacterium]|jgi:rod shape-determining protein MreC|nr:rod shape-determining protein MreC [Holophagales bacterium]
MRSKRWFWNPVWQKRCAMALLVLGHLFWVFLGKHLFPMWRGLTTFFVRPVETISAKLENWRFERARRINDIDAAQHEMDALRSELAELRIERQKDSVLLAEADAAKNLLGLKKLLPIEMRTARVIANNRNAPFGGIVIDLGKNDGLVADQGVICADGVVGRIWSVGLSQSIVLPLDAHNASTSVMLAKSRATGVLQGFRPGLARILYISSQEAVQQGEPVYTSGLDNTFPRGMLIGYVVEASPSPGAFEMDILVALASPLDTLNLLFVLPGSTSLEFDTRLEPPQSASRRGAR